MSLWNGIKSLREALSPNCREAVRAQSEAREHPLPPARRLGLWLHLLICKWCWRYGKQIKFLGEAAHEHHEELVEAGPQKLSPDARERIKQHLQNSK
ncbi:MAG TPA: hypothetical protein VH251_04305 [Verrucomicrobiae bacterium]|nr:hypothetical protein [Verrucomicrobiae bacterium]